MRFIISLYQTQFKTMNKIDAEKNIKNLDLAIIICYYKVI